MNRTLLVGPIQPPSCVLSPCGRYRYELRIPLSSSGTVVLFILANPSTAVVTDGVFKSDRTITKRINYAKRWGMGTLLVGNVRAWRETNPELVPPDPEAIGDENDAYLKRLADEAHMVIGGWGKLGGDRGLAAARLLREAGKPLYALKRNGDGSPAHPLYLAARLTPQLVTEAHRG